jgi:hypothetical protein
MIAADLLDTLDGALGVRLTPVIPMMTVLHDIATATRAVVLFQ